MNTKFGPAGNSESFFEQGYKSSLEAPEYLASMGLDAYEYQCGRGVKISEDACRNLKAESEKHGIILSVHSPYYINIATPEEEKKIKSIGYIMQTAKAASLMGADRIVVHMGAAGKITRAEGIGLSKELIKNALAQMDAEGLGNITICLETMGKVNQLGTSEETAEVCAVDERLFPCVDFGHINAREQGSLAVPSDFEKIVNVFENTLGAYRAERIHVHFSKIEYTHMGERKHLTFEDAEYGPEFENFAEIICKKNMQPRIICESAGTQAEDALYMKNVLKGMIK